LRYQNALRVLSENGITERDLAVDSRMGIGSTSLMLMDQDALDYRLERLNRDLATVQAYEEYGLPPPRSMPNADEIKRQIQITELFAGNRPGAPAQETTTTATPTVTQPTTATAPEAPAATQPTTATAPTAPAAPTARPTITPPTEEGIAALFNDMATRTQQPAQQPKYRSRYEDRLAEIEAEKKNRMGALIDFLQAAGASGGTNLGATLMGGGSGLRAREERLRQQEADTLKSIIEDENTQAQREFNERQLAQQAAQAAEDRALRLALSDKESNLRKELAGMDIKSAELIARKRNEMEMELRELLDANNIRTEDAASLRTMYNDYASRYEEAYKAYVSGTLNDEQKLEAIDEMRKAEAELNSLRARLAPQTEIDAQTQADLDRYQQE